MRNQIDNMEWIEMSFVKWLGSLCELDANNFVFIIQRFSFVWQEQYFN